MTQIKCNSCGQVFEVPDGTCPICFGNHLGDLCDIEDREDRFYELQTFINNLTRYDYERGLHNAKCSNQLDGEEIDDFKFTDIEEVDY